MEVSQSRISHLSLCFILTLLTHAGYSESLESKIKHQINKTFFVGDTATLHCINASDKDDIIWKMNNSVIFNSDSFHKKNMTNFTSERMYIKPGVPMELKINQIETSDAGSYSCFYTKASIGWTLTITEKQVPSKQISIYIISLCAGLLMICLIISLSIWIKRKWKSNEDTGHRETGQEITPARRRIQTHHSQYFESRNKVINV